MIILTFIVLEQGYPTRRSRAISSCGLIWWW